MIKVNYKPQTDIEAYLNNDFNIQIYDVLTNEKSKHWEGWHGTFEPFEFFNLLYREFEFVKANKAKPLTVVKHLQKLEIKGDKKHPAKYKRYFFLWYLHLLRDENNNEKDGQLKICFDFIDTELSKIERILFPKDEKENELPGIVTGKQ